MQSDKCEPGEAGAAHSAPNPADPRTDTDIRLMAYIKQQREKLAALSRIIRRALACGQLEKLEDAKRYLDDANQPAPTETGPCEKDSAGWCQKHARYSCESAPQGAPHARLCECGFFTCEKCKWVHGHPSEVV